MGGQLYFLDLRLTYGSGGRRSKVKIGWRCGSYCPYRFPFLVRLSVAQIQNPGQPLTLQQAVQHAMDNYPAIRASQAHVAAQEAGVGISARRLSTSLSRTAAWIRHRWKATSQTNTSTISSGVTVDDIGRRIRKYYSVTPKGRRHLQRAKRQLSELVREVFDEEDLRLLFGPWVSKAARSGASSRPCDSPRPKASDPGMTPCGPECRRSCDYAL
jgi:hypothetical protein